MSPPIRSLDVVDEAPRRDLPAGDFSAWLRRTRSTQLRGEGANVPCGECTACCRSSLFVHIAPEEAETLARIPQALLVPAPGRPKGHMVLGYDAEGRCPMLDDRGCSIYEHRPRACREYDCRIFPAAGVAAREEGKVLIDRQARRWRFDYPTEQDREEHAAVRAVVALLREHPEVLGDETPSAPTRLALLAIEVYEAFLQQRDDTGGAAGRTDADPRIEAVRAAAARLAARGRNESRR